MRPQQPRDDDAHGSSDDEGGTEFSDYVALSTADEAARPTAEDAARRRPRDARPDAWTAPVLDDALQRRPIKPPPPPAADALPPPRPTSVRFVPQRPPCKSLRELALDALSQHAELIPTDAVDALDEATAADVVRWIMAKQKLTTSIAQRFMASRHVELSRALGELDLVAGVSTYGDGYCPRLSRGPGM